MKIDCAQNNTIAQELTTFLRKGGHSANQDDDLIIIDEKLHISILESFLKKTDRSKHKITIVDSDTYLIAIPMDLEDIGLESCEFCGYLGHPEEVEVHRRSHQAL